MGLSGSTTPNPPGNQITAGTRPWLINLGGLDSVGPTAGPYSGWVDIGQVRAFGENALLVASETGSSLAPGVWKINATTFAVISRLRTDGAFAMDALPDGSAFAYANQLGTTLNVCDGDGTVLHTYTASAGIVSIAYNVGLSGWDATAIRLVLTSGVTGVYHTDTQTFSAAPTVSGALTSVVMNPGAAGLVVTMHDGILFYDSDFFTLLGKVWMSEPSAYPWRTAAAPAGDIIGFSSADLATFRNSVWPLSWAAVIRSGLIKTGSTAAAYPLMMAPLPTNQFVPHGDDPNLLYGAWWNGIYVLNLRSYRAEPYPVTVTSVNPGTTLATGNSLFIGPAHGSPFWNRADVRVSASQALTLKVRVPLSTAGRYYGGITRVGGPVTAAMLTTQWQDLSAANRDIVLPVAETFTIPAGSYTISTLAGRYPTYFLELSNAGGSTATINAFELFASPA